MNPFVERYQEDVVGVLSCFDQVIVTGTLPDICHPKAMAGFLGSHNIRLFDYALWAAPLREELRANAERVAAEAGLKVEFIRHFKAFRKEDRIKAILAERGDHPGRSQPIQRSRAATFQAAAPKPSAPKTPRSHVIR